MDKYQKIWNEIRNKLAKNFSETTFEQIFGQVKKVVAVENQTIYVLVPSTFLKTKINTLYIKTIKATATSVTEEKIDFKFVCEDEVPQPKKPSKTKLTTTTFNSDYTFEELVVGDFNKMSYVMAQKIVEKPGLITNPFYIFGGVGLGKTHLMQAIGHALAQKNPDLKIIYIPASAFMDDYVKAIQIKDMQQFEEKYENIDILLIDDIQQLETANKSQQEFFKLFNDLTTRKKQIVITSDKPVAKLTGIMDRLISRFQGGTVVDITRPNFNDRCKILKQKCLKDHSEIEVPEEVINYIAENCKTNIRELEGALTRVLLYSEVCGNNKLSVDVAAEALEPILKNSKKEENEDYENLFSVICATYGITQSDLLGKSRSSKFVLPRHIAMYILKTKYDLTYTKIGSLLNGRDHTTIMNGYLKIEEELKSDRNLKMAIDNIIKKV